MRLALAEILLYLTGGAALALLLWPAPVTFAVTAVLAGGAIVSARRR